MVLAACYIEFRLWPLCFTLHWNDLVLADSFGGPRHCDGFVKLQAAMVKLVALATFDLLVSHWFKAISNRASSPL